MKEEIKRAVETFCLWLTCRLKLKVTEAIKRDYVLVRLKDGEVSHAEYECINSVMDSMRKAKRLHPDFPSDGTAAVSIITEELGELAQAVNDRAHAEHRATEAEHVIVTAFRYRTMLREETGI